MIKFIINIISFCAPLMATIIIAILQYKQSARMEDLAVRQDEIEKKQREQYVKKQRDTFIIKYKNDADDIYYLPLCWISSFYDSSFSYHREMCREYNMLEEEVQDAICDFMNLKIPKPDEIGDDFYYQCVEAIEEQQYKYDSKDDNFTIFNDGAKYLHRCIECYKKEHLPVELYDLESKFTDLLRKYQENNDNNSNPIKIFAEETKFSCVDELVACEICAVVAEWIARWGINSFEDEVLFWIPGGYGCEKIETMEDLFLLVLLCIYVYLIFPERMSN